MSGFGWFLLTGFGRGLRFLVTKFGDLELRLVDGLFGCGIWVLIWFSYSDCHDRERV